MEAEKRTIVLITGPSGAGLSTASKALEDTGFEAIDNLPLRLVLPLLEQPGPDKPMALGLDLRSRDFSAEALLEVATQIEEREEQQPQLLYIDCRIDELLRRYSSTRRRHPTHDAPSLISAIAREVELLKPLRERADVLIDSSDLNPHELRAEIERWYCQDGHHKTSVELQSFSYRRGLPRSVDVVFDCRFLRNPHWDEALRPKDGRSPEIQDYVAQDDRFDGFRNRVRDLCLFLLPAVEAEGKSYLRVAFGCTGGRHRSVTMVETLTKDLAKAGWPVSTRHRELDLHRSGGGSV